MLHTISLPVLGIHLDIHRPVYCVGDVGPVGACKFVCHLHALTLPVCPVQVVFKLCQCKDVWNVYFDYVLPILTIQISHCYIIKPCISPEDVVGDKVNGECIRPAERVVYEDSALTAIHTQTTYVCLVSPVSVKQPAFPWVYRDGPWFLQVVSHKYLAI